MLGTRRWAPPIYDLSLCRTFMDLMPWPVGTCSPTPAWMIQCVIVTAIYTKRSDLKQYSIRSLLNISNTVYCCIFWLIWLNRKERLYHPDSTSNQAWWIHHTSAYIWLHLQHFLQSPAAVLNQAQYHILIKQFKLPLLTQTFI